MSIKYNTLSPGMPRQFSQLNSRALTCSNQADPGSVLVPGRITGTPAIVLENNCLLGFLHRGPGYSSHIQSCIGYIIIYNHALNKNNN